MLVAAVTIAGFCRVAAEAQLAVDNTSFSSGDASTLRYAHTIAAGSDALLMVGVEVHAHTTVSSVEWGTGSTRCASACTPASCLCPLTQVGTVTDSSKAVTVQLWKLVNPPAATGDVVVTLLSNHRMVSGATSFVGVNHTTPLGAPASNSAETGTPASVEVASVPGGMVLDAVGTTFDSTLAVAGTGQTQQYRASVSAGAIPADGTTGAGSTAAGAATVTMSWRLSSASWAIIAVPINPAPTPTGAPPSPTPRPTPTAVASTCVGDCDGSGSVTVNDLIIMVNVALGSAPLSECPVGDADGSGDITVNEIITAVGFALTSCPAT